MRLPFSNFRITHQNPGAQDKLILPVNVLCNTDDEQLHSNIRINSRREGKWVKLEKEHDGIAILCGSGPSIADYIEDIKFWQKSGATVFAMNGAANYLLNNGILADYQCILDAREITVAVVGEAKEHLFASQVHPACFDKKPDAKVWHLQIEGIDDLLPEYDEGYCLIGGAASVGNTATCLAYAMGYRNLQLYGYDSSNKAENSHAFHQPINDGEPMVSVRFGGNDYIASITMKLQAEKIIETTRALIQHGVHIDVHGYGLFPDMWQSWGNIKKLEEQAKYELMWTHDAYRDVAPGELCAQVFIDKFNPHGNVIDFGCGTGRGALKLHEAGCDMLLLDFTENSRDTDALSLSFKLCDLTLPIDVDGVEYGYCTDVMEHIEPDKVDSVICNIMAVAENVFFQISLVPDVMGSLIGQDLHLSVHPAAWWADKFSTLGFDVKWTQDEGISAFFYVSNHLER